MSTESDKPQEQQDQQDSAGQNPEQSAKQADDVEAGDQLDAGQAEIEALNEQLLLTQAEMQNVRRRAERDVEQARKFALEKMVGDLLPVVDNLERAIAAIDRDSEANKPVLEGIELTLKGFLDALKRHQVEQVDPQGQPFDPEHHQAMTTVPQPDVAPNTVIEVFQKGYLLNGRLVRPAMVVVSQNGQS